VASSRFSFNLASFSAPLAIGCALITGCGSQGTANDEQELRTAATQVVESMVDHDVDELCRHIAAPQGLDTQAWAESCPRKVQHEYQSSNAVIPNRAEVISVNRPGFCGDGFHWVSDAS